MMSFLSSENKYQRLWKIIERNKHLSKEQFKEATQIARRDDRHLTDVLFEQHPSSREKLLTSLAEYYQVPAILLHKKTIVSYVLNLIPKEVAEQHSVIVFKKKDKVIHIALTNPTNTQTINFIKKKTGLTPQVFITTPEDIKHALQKYESEIISEFAQIIQNSINAALAISDSAEKMAQYVPIIKIVESIIEQALNQNASDIHLEPTANSIVVRFRIDGLLNKVVVLPSEILPALVTRIKILANLKIDEHRTPQDGRFNFIFHDREVAIRVAAIPTLHGTKIVMRLLDQKESQFTLQKLGLNQRDLTIVKNELNKPHGMILVCGPTGSGKTTTLYTLLRLLNTEDVNICTIEDPIEYGIEGVNQTQINPMAGLTFASGLKSLLRQDPNIIMIGEIRDSETADLAVNAAMTGHLVLSTLHTNNAFLVTQRLSEMGIQPFLIGSVTNVIIGQRLVRTICPECRSLVSSKQKTLEHYNATLKLDEIFIKLKSLNLLPYQNLSQASLYFGKGCPNCNNTGYLGRVGIYEVLKIDTGLQSIIIKDPTAEKIRLHALKQNTLTMLEDGVLKALTGLTTFEEILRVTKE